MSVTVNRQVLLDVLNAFAPGPHIGTDSEVVCPECGWEFGVMAGDHRDVTLSASDGRLQVQITDDCGAVIDCEVDGPMLVKVRLAKLAAALGVIEGTTIRLDQQGDLLLVVGGGGGVALKTFSDPEVIDIAHSQLWHGATPIQIDERVASAIPFVSTDETRVSLTRVHLQASHGKWIAEATSGTRLAQIEISPLPFFLDGAALEPDVVRLLMLFAGCDDVIAAETKMVRQPNTLVVSAVGLMVWGCVFREFPKTSAVVPKTASAVVEVDSTALRRALLLREISGQGVELSFSEDSFEIAGCAAGALLTGPVEPVTIMANPTYLMQALGDSDRATISCNESLSPIRVDVPGQTHVVMPRRR